MTTYGERLEAALVVQIKVELVERGMDQKALADKVGINAVTLSKYMTNKRGIPMATFFKIADALGVSPMTLMQRSEARVQPESQTA